MTSACRVGNREDRASAPEAVLVSNPASAHPTAFPVKTHLELSSRCRSCGPAFVRAPGRVPARRCAEPVNHRAAQSSPAHSHKASRLAHSEARSAARLLLRSPPRRSWVVKKSKPMPREAGSASEHVSSPCNLDASKSFVNEYTILLCPCLCRPSLPIPVAFQCFFVLRCAAWRARYGYVRPDR